MNLKQLQLANDRKKENIPTEVLEYQYDLISLFHSD